MAKKKVEIWMDTQVIIYALRTNKELSPAARDLIRKAGEGMFTLKLSPLIVDECVFVLMGKQFELNKEQVKTVLTSFINLKGVECEEKSVIEETLSDYSRKEIDFIDAYLHAHARSVKPKDIVSVNIQEFRNLGAAAQTLEDVIKALDKGGN